MNKIVGFVHINKNATTCKGAKNPKEFIGQTCAVIEFGVDDSVLVLNPQSTALAMFEKKDVYRCFKCGYSNGIVTPPNLEFLEQMMYVDKAQQRKGGYDGLVRNMVIQLSLMKGKFNDGFLWEMQ
jgi:hypothetical protein